MHARNFFQNDRQINRDVGLDKILWLDMLMVRELFNWRPWIRGMVIAKKDGTAPAMIVSIKTFFNRGASALGKLLVIKDPVIPEFSSAREKG